MRWRRASGLVDTMIETSGQQDGTTAGRGAGDTDSAVAAPLPSLPRALLQVLLVSLQLGCTSFGGPVAHLAYYRERYVQRLRWLTERDYADLVALCQFLPGPTSSQVGMGIGVRRAGSLGALAAFTGFTLPSAVLMIAAGYGVLALDPGRYGGLLTGLKAAAVAVVAQAVWHMGKTLCPDRARLSMALITAMVLAMLPFVWLPAVMIVVSGLVGFWWFREAGRLEVESALRIKPAQPLPGDSEDSAAPSEIIADEPECRSVHPRIARFCLTAFFAILLGLPAIAIAAEAGWLRQLDSFFRAGSLVFGGGHVLLPLLDRETVEAGLVTPDTFLAGYGLAQAVPGPLFTFAAYLGTVMDLDPSGWRGGLWCLAAVFLPSILLLLGILPAWEGLRRVAVVRAGLMGANAAVVGLLLAALYHPIWTAGVPSGNAFALVLLAFLALQILRAPAWMVVLAVAGLGMAVA